jgi:hypothetical protein
MKRLLYILGLVVLSGAAGCKKSDFADAYADPSKLPVTTVDKQFSGMITTFANSNHDKGQHGYIVPSYWNYFVILRTTLLRYTQAVGWENTDNQYVPGGAAVGDRWNDYYNLVAQYREIQKVYSKLTAEEQAARRIFMIAADIFFYDQTQKVVDLHGDIPWSEAGMLSTNNGDYKSSLPKYDKAEDIYTKMLDDLKAYADELTTITLDPAVDAAFKGQDYINRASLDLWKRYCNSLRMRMLTRVSDVPAFTARYNTEMAAILGDPAKYPIVTTNAQNIKISVYDPVNTDITSKNFQTGLEDWNGNLAGKVMIDHMKTSLDPRIRAMYEPGTGAAGVYNGVDPMANRGTQNTQITAGQIAIYNRSTISRNDFFPGILITASEVKFMIAEYQLKSNNAAAAKTAYDEGVTLSAEFYFWLRTLSNDNTAGALTPLAPAEVTAYLATPAVNFNTAVTNADKLKLIAMQKWIHFSVIQPIDSWAEIRRLNAPTLSFEVDNSTAQSQPPVRWMYAFSESVFNAENYAEVQANDKLTTKIFWDLN